MLKRSFDIVASLAGAVVSAPVVVPLAIMMAIDTRSNPFFLQERTGLNGNTFKIIKIKTMKDPSKFDAPVEDEQRTSKLGRFVRKTRMDELPQFFNVLAGDMSIVGPRPCSSRNPLYQSKRRHQVKPGMTGLAQIAGMNALSLEQVLDKDLEYIENIQKRSTVSAFLYDLSIVAKTPFAIARHLGAPHTRKNYEL